VSSARPPGKHTSSFGEDVAPRHEGARPAAADVPQFDPGAVFEVFGMRPVDTAGFDALVAEAPGDELRCVFMWGNDCYNCNVFKNTALMLRDRIQALGLDWYQANVYQDEALGRRFGLHGVPAFVFYRGGKRLGRISGWPGLPQFSAAVQRLRAAAAPGEALSAASPTAQAEHPPPG
jgi:hypothetical protein